MSPSRHQRPGSRLSLLQGLAVLAIVGIVAALVLSRFVS